MRSIVGVRKFPRKLSRGPHNHIRLRKRRSWIFQAEWRSSVRRRPLDAATLGGSEQSLQLFRGQLAESAAR